MYTIGHFVYGYKEQEFIDCFKQFFKNSTKEQILELFERFEFEDVEEIYNEFKLDKLTDKNFDKLMFESDLIEMALKEGFRVCFDHYDGGDVSPRLLFCVELDSFSCIQTYSFKELQMGPTVNQIDEFEKNKDIFTEEFKKYLNNLTPEIILCFSTS